MNLVSITAAILATASLVSSKIYLRESFDGDNWQSVWKTPSSNDNLGSWEISAGKFHADSTVNRGLRTMNDLKFYALAAPFEHVFNNEKGDLVVQFSAKNEQNLNCGGAYVKVIKLFHSVQFLNLYSYFLLKLILITSMVKHHTRSCLALMFVDQPAEFT